jgi:anti-sigma regulatory factor (Ser/Thr protein kinase)
MVASPSESLALELKPDLGAPARARRAVTALAGGDDALQRRLALLTTELVTNSLRHSEIRAEDRIELRGSRTGRRVVVEVHDPGRAGRMPAIRSDDPLQGEGGLGLRLVDQLADEWGAGPVPGNGTRAWFVLH